MVAQDLILEVDQETMVVLQLEEVLKRNQQKKKFRIRSEQLLPA